MELFKEELKFRPTGNKVVVNWKEAESTLTLSPEMMMMKEIGRTSSPMMDQCKKRLSMNLNLFET